MNLPPEAERLPGGPDLVHAVLIGGDVEALTWVPRLFRDPQINLLGLLPTHPADLIRHLAVHGYALCEPGPLNVFADFDQLAGLARLDLIIDTTLDPATVRRLGDAGLEAVPRVNSGALGMLLARPPVAGERTVLPDRAAFSRRLTKELGRAYRHGRTLGLVLIEVTIDGRHGPLPEGVVDAVSQAIEQSLRIEDVVAWLPEGTFAVLLPETGDATRHVTDRLTSNLAELRIRRGPQGAAGAAPGAGEKGTGAETETRGEGSEAPGVLRLTQAAGWAWFPQDAKTAQALMEQARGRMGPPSPLGR